MKKVDDERVIICSDEALLPTSIQFNWNEVSSNVSSRDGNEFDNRKYNGFFQFLGIDSKFYSTLQFPNIAFLNIFGLFKIKHD